MHPAETPGTYSALVGKVLNERYHVLAVIGSGGMATVYRAQDERLGRTVALKVLHPQLAADPTFVRRFRREAESAAGLSSHPHIVSLHDVDEDGDVHYLVMEYVPGSNLKELITQTAPFPVERARSIGRQVALALNSAHEQGLVHRDIKPHNILIGPDDQVKVTDFGIARQVDATQMTQSGMVAGTAAYLSPEQAAGKPAEPASDIYALGVVLFEMLTGRLPFEGDSPVAVAMQHLLDRPIPPHELNPAVDASTSAIVLRALAKDPSARYPSAAAFGTALQEQSRSSIGERTAYRPLDAGMTVHHRRLVQASSRHVRPLLFGLMGLAGAVILALIFTAGLGRGHGHRLAARSASPGTVKAVHPRPVATARPQATAESTATVQPTAELAETAHPAAQQPTSQPRRPTAPQVAAPGPANHPTTAPPASSSVSSALDEVRSAVAAAGAAGQVQPNVANDLDHSLDDLQAQLSHGEAQGDEHGKAHGEANNIDHKIADLQHKVDDHVHNGKITQAGAQRIDAALADLQTAATGVAGPKN